jgi:hypothetical protein
MNSEGLEVWKRSKIRLEVGGWRLEAATASFEFQVTSFLIAEFGMRIAEWKRKKTAASLPSPHFFP